MFFARPPRFPSGFEFVWLFVVGAVLAGCHPNESHRSSAAWPAPAPSHYRDFEGPDALSAYLRSDALPLIAAHRGGPAASLPENALPTFAQALTHGPVLIEADVRMTRDSVLVLIHDETLTRTTTGEGPVRAQTLRELRGHRLVAEDDRPTPYQIPTAAEALAWAEGRAVLQLDVKEAVPPRLVTALLRRHDARDRVVVITYSLDDARWYHQQMPSLLLSVSAETRAEAERYLEQIAPSRLLAFAGVGPPAPKVVQAFARREVPVAVGTFGNLDRQARQQGLVVYRDLFRQGVTILSTDETALASQAAATYQGTRRPSTAAP
jgi:glycerophosphoryl diester phosphodiesterase